MTQHQCLSCGRTENDVPLIALSYTAGPLWICPQCLPVLIHHPDKLTGKIPGLKIPGGKGHGDKP